MWQQFRVVEQFNYILLTLVLSFLLAVHYPNFI